MTTLLPYISWALLGAAVGYCIAREPRCEMPRVFRLMPVLSQAEADEVAEAVRCGK